MITRLIRWSLSNRAAVLSLAILLCAVGAYEAFRMPVDVFPDLSAPTVTVLTEAHGMAPSEVESQITFPIETALNGAAGVRRVRSSTAVGLSIVWVEFDWGADLRSARQVVNEKLALIEGSLPPEVERPILAPMSSIMGEIFFIAVTSDRLDPMELRTMAESVVRRRLLSVPGVSQVTAIGGERKQYQVVLNAGRLAAHRVSMKQVSDALEASNENLSAGFVHEGGSEYLITGVGRFRTYEDIREVVVSVSDGVPVRIADLGDVRPGAEPKRGEGSANGRPAVILSVQKQPEANTLALTREIEEVLADLGRKHPQVVIDSRIFRQADFIQVAIDNVLHALRDGSILVILIVLVFLANVRATAITLTALPLSLLAAVAALQFFGATINTMTLGGMAIAIGALVDDAVIDVENVFRRLRENAKLEPSLRQNPIAVTLRASRSEERRVGK